MFDQNIGKHCEVETCKQKDWLPVRCKYCSGVYCADHCSIQSHSCPKYEAEYKKVITCPLCNKTLLINPHLNETENFQIHEAMDCDKKYMQNVKKVPTCVGIRCNAKLTAFNQIQCNQCHKKTCLKHRMPEDHKCLQIKYY